MNKTENRYEEINTNFQRIQILMCILGILSNILTIVIFSRKTLKKYTFSFYCRILVFIDSLLLAHILIHYSIVVVKSLNESLEHEYAKGNLIASFFCSIKDFLGFAFGTMSLFILTLISLDRFLSVVYPNRFRIFKQRWFQIILVFIAVLYSSLANINVLVYFRYETVDSGNGVKKSICYLPFDKQNIQSWIIFSQFFIANLIINNFFNIRIIMRIVESRRKSRKITQLSLKDRKFAISSIGLNITSFITRIPIAAGILLSNYLGFTPEQSQLVFTISITVATLDHSLTLLINILLNSLFYEEFLIIFGIRKQRHLFGDYV